MNNNYNKVGLRTLFRNIVTTVNDVVLGAGETARNLTKATTIGSEALVSVSETARVYARNLEITSKATKDIELKDDLMNTFIDSEVNRIENETKITNALTESGKTDEKAKDIVAKAKTKTDNALAKIGVKLD